MSAQSRLETLIAAIGADVKTLTTSVNSRVLRVDSKDDVVTAANWRVNFTGVMATSVANTFEVYVNGVMRAWTNEWGGIRGRVGAHATYADAAVRGIVQTGDYTGTGSNGGNAIEIEDRRLASGKQRQRWGRRWENGAIVRNGVEQIELYTWTSGDADPTVGATVSRPANARYLILLEGAETAPAWTAENDIVLKVAAAAVTPATIDTTITGVSLEQVRDELGNNVIVPASFPQDGLTVVHDDVNDKIRLGLDWRHNEVIERGYGWNVPKDGAATVDSLGCIGITATGTATLSLRSITNRHTRARRIDYLVTAAAANVIAGWRLATNHLVRGNAAGVGGFYTKQIWGPATGVANTTTSAFVGLANNTAAPTSIEASAQTTTFIGCGWDSADTNMQMMYRNAGTTVKVDLGTDFPVPTVDRAKWFATEIWCDPNDTKYSWKITDLATGISVAGDTGASTEVPPNTTYICERGWLASGATSSVVGIAFGGNFYEHEGW